ncbi:MAG: DUF262 domain-containing protein [Dehalococcoidia bacterium]
MQERGSARDIEEEDDVLDSIEGDSVEFWEQKQRELVTSAVDYNLGTLADLVEQGAIDLSPGYQRRFRWDAVRQSLLIESFLMNVPVPPIFLNEDAYGNYSVIDGKQRLTAIRAFLEDELTLAGLNVFGELNGRKFSTLPAKLQSALRTRPTLRSMIILRQSDEDVKSLVFHRLNTGGQRLNAQEVRNNAYPGPLNDLIVGLSGDPRFHRLLRIKNLDKSVIYREMRDVEFVLRFLAFQQNWQTFSGGMERHMDRYMEDNQFMAEQMRSDAKRSFMAAIDKVEAAFDGHAFQRWVPTRNQWRQQVLAALYDAQMFGLQEFSVDDLAPRRDSLVEGLKGLFSEPEFRGAVDSATNTPGSFRRRVRLMRDMVARAIEG